MAAWRSLTGDELGSGATAAKAATRDGFEPVASARFHMGVPHKPLGRAGKRTQRCRYCGQLCRGRTCAGHRDLESLDSISVTAGYELARDGERPSRREDSL
jgi:hypothetical protein